MPNPLAEDRDFLPQRLAVALVAVNILLAGVLAVFLIILTLDASNPPIQTVPAATADTPSSVGTTSPRLPPQQSRHALFYTLLTMLVAGGTGGTLCNLRGLFRWMAAKNGKFPRAYGLPFVIRPFTGSLTGLFMFFVGNLLVSALADVRPRAWETLDGRLPYIGMALLAGFAAQEFMQRLKEVAKTTFGVKGDSENEEAEEVKEGKKLQEGAKAKAP